MHRLKPSSCTNLEQHAFPSLSNLSVQKIDHDRIVLDEDNREQITCIRQAHDHNRNADHGVQAGDELAEDGLGHDVPVADGGDHRGREEHGREIRPLLIVGPVRPRVVLVGQFLLFCLSTGEFLIDQLIEPFGVHLDAPAGIVDPIVSRPHATPESVA